MEATETTIVKILTAEEIDKLQSQNGRLVDEHKARLLEVQAKKHWDLFYKRNETRFFKDRHWTIREFCELLDQQRPGKNAPRTLFEVGCGVGNFFYPLLEEQLDFFVVACDLSPRAIEMVKSNPLYSEDKIRAFSGDVTMPEIVQQVGANTVDLATLIFVLSAIHPDKFMQTLRHLHAVLKPGAVLLFRDYGLYDMAQIRFKAGHKIADNFYMRQDGTRSYYFSLEEVESMLQTAGFKVLKNSYVHRRTVNKKENIDVPRIFVQTKACKVG